MIMTIVVVAAFQNLANMSNAYGFAVATVMFSTSVLIAIQIPAIKHLPVLVGIAYFLTFGFFDGMFLV
jgi:KUP system potassium uptake protein